jgi:Flp pilus assembly pilin Flp
VKYVKRKGVGMYWIELGTRLVSRAQSTVEYALVGALVVIAAAGALTILGGELTTVFTNISRTLGAAAGR